MTKADAYVIMHGVRRHRIWGKKAKNPLTERRRALVEKVAAVLCRLDGKDPDKTLPLGWIHPGHPRMTQPAWWGYTSRARRQLIAAGWPDE